MKRFILDKLLVWRQQKSRNPLILKGARQVGKTYALTEFGETHFPRYHLFNFEKEPRLTSIFDEDLDPHRIIKELSLHRQTSINMQDDLIIFDEIQACPKALTSLKYFCEDAPNIYLCTAGSLLGVYLNPVSYPVGKVDHLEMYPLSFLEFLLAMGDEQYVALLTKQHPISTLAHEHLWKRLKTYFITGGLPEVVSLYCKHQADPVTAFQLVRDKQRNLIEDYFSDIAKHSGKINAMHIHRIWRNIPEQLAKTQDGCAAKFKFKGIIPGVDRYQKLADALDWLTSAGLVLKVNIINKGALPFKAYTKDNSLKLFIFDVGILGALAEINPVTLWQYDYGTYKGYFAENFAAQAFTFATSMPLYSWTENTAEIEFVREIKGQIIPIEVKSGWVTKAKSLTVFANKYHPSYSVIMSARNPDIRPNTHTQFWPLYLVELFPFT